jgi:hypothetical protein
MAAAAPGAANFPRRTAPAVQTLKVKGTGFGLRPQIDLHRATK